MKCVLKYQIINEHRLTFAKCVRNWLILFVLIQAGFSSCKDKNHEKPEADFSVFPKFGDTVTVFLFDASTTVPINQDVWTIRVRWDWENDGSWDTDFSLDKTVIHRYRTWGMHSVQVEVLDINGLSDTCTEMVHVRPTIKDSILFDPRDQQSYSILRIDNLWLMTEDLAFGATIPLGSVPSDNGIPERWVLPDSFGVPKTKQGFYTEHEVTNYSKDRTKGICPEGWRIPTQKDNLLLHDFFWHQFNEFVRQDSLLYRFNPAYHGYYYQKTGEFNETNELNHYWMLQSNGIMSFTTGYNAVWWDSELESSWEERLGQPFNKLWLGFAIRCVKNEP